MVYRAEFDPHGQAVYEWSQTGVTYLNSRKFTGYERNWATLLDDAKARSYMYKRGRFMQADPLGLGASDASDPQSLNLYGYVGNDPVNFVDPSGLNKEGEVCQTGRHDEIYDGRIGKDGKCHEVADPGPIVIIIVIGGGGGPVINPVIGGSVSGGGGGAGGSIDGNAKALPSGVGVCGVGASVAEYSNQVGNTWKGANGKWYPTTWGGNGATGARSATLGRAADYRFLGKAAFGIGAGFSFAQGAQAAQQGNYAGTAKAALDIMMGYLGTTSPAGAIVGGAYFGIDTFIGWDKVRSSTGAAAATCSITAGITILR